MFAVGAHDGSRVVAEISRPFVSLGKWISRFTRAFCLAPHHTCKPCICINSGALITFKHLKKQRVFQQKWNWRLLSNFAFKPLNCLNQFSFSSIVQSTLFCPSMPDFLVKCWNEFNFSAWCLRKGNFARHCSVPGFSVFTFHLMDRASAAKVFFPRAIIDLFDGITRRHACTCWSSGAGSRLNLLRSPSSWILNF